MLTRMTRVPLAVLAALACCSRARAPSPNMGDDDVPGLIEVELRADVALPLGEVVEKRSVEDDEYGEPFKREIDVELRVDPAEEASALRALRARDDVVWAEPVTRVRALWLPDDPDFSKHGHLKVAGAE